MPKYLSLESAKELFGLSPNSLMVNACNYKKKNGEYPKWYISNGKSGTGVSKAYLNMDIIESANTLRKTCWVLSTSYLYWWLTEWIGWSNEKLAEELAKRSKLFTKSDTWKSFLSAGLFAYPEGHVVEYNNCRMREFTIYGTAICLAYYRDNYQ